VRIRVDNVSKSYGDARARRVEALTGVTFTVEAEELVAVVGPSGCGKSTLLNLLAGLLRPDAGTIDFEGPLRAGRTATAMVFQEFALFPWLTVEENVLFGDKASKGSAQERRERATHYLDLVGLTAYRGYRPAQLSGGMRQRVALARAWANQPTVLLMDEPFGALDARTRQELQETLLRIFTEERTLCFFVTHDTSEAVYLADRVIVMHARGASRHEVDVSLPRPRDRHADAVRLHVKDVDRLAWDAK